MNQKIVIFAPDWFAYCRPAIGNEKGTGVKIPDSTRCCKSRLKVVNIIPGHWNKRSGKAFTNRDKSEDLPMTSMVPITSGEEVSETKCLFRNFFSVFFRTVFSIC